MSDLTPEQLDAIYALAELDRLTRL